MFSFFHFLLLHLSITMCNYLLNETQSAETIFSFSGEASVVPTPCIDLRPASTKLSFPASHCLALSLSESCIPLPADIFAGLWR